MDFSQIDTSRMDSFLADRRKVDMSKFWGDGCIVYARHATPADHAAVAKQPYAKGWPMEPTVAGTIHLITLIAQDEDGERFFKDPIGERKKLMKMPMEVIGELMTLAGDPIDLDDTEGAEGN